MKPTITREATHNFQSPANWDAEKNGPCGDLLARMETGNGMVEIFSTWKPSHQELLHLQAGGVVEIGLCVLNQPAMQVGVVDPVEPELVRYLPQVSDKREQALTINEDAHGHG